MCFRGYTFAAAILLACAVQGPSFAQAQRQLAFTTAPVPQAPRFFTIAEVMARHRDAVPVRAAAAAEIAPVAAAQPRAASDPFSARGYVPFPAAYHPASTRWSAMRGALAREAERITACRAAGRGCDARTRRFLAISQAAARLRGIERIAYVNRQVNAAVRYVSDEAQHGVADHWSSPLATLGAAGDCEDYAFAKFALLRAAGVPEADLRVVLLRDRRAGEDHAVLAVRESGRWHILDNRWDRIDSAEAVPHYAPVIALSAVGASLYAAPEPGRPAPALVTATQAAEIDEEWRALAEEASSADWNDGGWPPL